MSERGGEGRGREGWRKGGHTVKSNGKHNGSTFRSATFNLNLALASTRPERCDGELDIKQRSNLRTKKKRKYNNIIIEKSDCVDTHTHFVVFVVLNYQSSVIGV